MEEIKLKLKQLVDSDDDVNWKLVCEMVKGFDYDTKMYVRGLFIAKSIHLNIRHNRILQTKIIRKGYNLNPLDLPVFRDPTIPYLEELNEYVLTKMIENDRQRSVE